MTMTIHPSWIVAGKLAAWCLWRITSPLEFCILAKSRSLIAAEASQIEQLLRNAAESRVRRHASTIRLISFGCTR